MLSVIVNAKECVYMINIRMFCLLQIGVIN
jgi:hypothetical protein